MENSLRRHGFALLKHNNFWTDECKLLGRVTLPVDTELNVQRIYIRVGQNGFDSVTFCAKHKDGLKGRFWAKLNDVNTIEMEIIT